MWTKRGGQLTPWSGFLARPRSSSSLSMDFWPAWAEPVSQFQILRRSPNFKLFKPFSCMPKTASTCPFTSGRLFLFTTTSWVRLL